jgi:hypothetical protein
MQADIWSGRYGFQSAILPHAIEIAVGSFVFLAILGM